MNSTLQTALLYAAVLAFAVILCHPLAVTVLHAFQAAAH